MAALLSAHTSRRAAKPKSRAMAARPMPSAAPLTIPGSSASPELKAMVFCVANQCLMACIPRMHRPPLVGLRVCRHPAKSASM
eukprot:2592757-Alexandrium_andersonii.AAC.1